jgi:ornithine cyclodeaminase/alanine dehydrogenase-like protein (mu-crystallin family)
MRECFAAEAAGKTRLPHRIDTPTGKGFLRVMPAVFDDVMGLKIMTLVEGVGNRYMVLLYQVDTGALLAMFDADELTRIRTAATTALAGLQMCATPPERMGLIGTGFEAVGHLRTMAHIWPLRTVHAYSPNAERRERFAAQMSAELKIDVKAVATSREALAGMPCVVLATKAKQAVVDGADFAPGAVVLSIGSTRLDLRELDDRSLERAAVRIRRHRRQHQERQPLTRASSSALRACRRKSAAEDLRQTRSARAQDGRNRAARLGDGTCGLSRSGDASPRKRHRQSVDTQGLR